MTESLEIIRFNWVENAPNFDLTRTQYVLDEWHYILIEFIFYKYTFIKESWMILLVQLNLYCIDGGDLG